MAARLSADNQFYTASISSTAYTAMTLSCWGRLDTDRNDYSTFVCLDDNAGAAFGTLQCTADGTTVMYSDPGIESSGVALTVGTWYFMAVAKSGTTGTLYVRAAGATSWTTVALSGLVSSLTVNTIRIGETTAGSDWLNGSVASVKYWLGAQLSQADLDDEFNQYLPRRTLNLSAFFPLLTATDVADLSGAGLTLSGGSGAADTDSPPISWRGPIVPQQSVDPAPNPVFAGIGTQLQVNPGTTTSVPVPAGVAVDDIIVVDMFLDGAATVSAMPSGFAHVTGSPMTVTGTGAHSHVVAWKRATGADTGTYDFTLASAGYVNAAASRFTGCITSGSPWDAVDAQASTAQNTTSPPTSVTTTGPDRLLYWSATNWSGGAWTPPTSFTERRDSGDEVMTSADLVQAVAGSSGSVVGTCVGNDRRTAFLGALQQRAGTSAVSDVPIRRSPHRGLTMR